MAIAMAIARAHLCFARAAAGMARAVRCCSCRRRQDTRVIAFAERTFEFCKWPARACVGSEAPRASSRSKNCGARAVPRTFCRLRTRNAPKATRDLRNRSCLCDRPLLANPQGARSTSALLWMGTPALPAGVPAVTGCEDHTPASFKWLKIQRLSVS